MFHCRHVTSNACNKHVTRHTPHATRHTPHVTRHTPHATRHTSHVTRHTSHITRHTSQVTRHLQVCQGFGWTLSERLALAQKRKRVLQGVHGHVTVTRRLSAWQLTAPLQPHQHLTLITILQRRALRGRGYGPARQRGVQHAPMQRRRRQPLGRNNRNSRSATRLCNAIVCIPRHTHAGVRCAGCCSAGVNRCAERDGEEVQGVLAAAVELVKTGETYCPAENESASLSENASEERDASCKV